MKKLTENIIKQRMRTGVSEIEKIVQINLTGRDLEDVSLLNRMTNVEILALSFNKISSLQDFQNCVSLKELYLRRNNITDLKDVAYLKNLHKLQMLMLSENPCSYDPLYRPTIIRNLKGLLTLDGTPITDEERRQAREAGLKLDDRGDSTRPKKSESVVGKASASSSHRGTVVRAASQKSSDRETSYSLDDSWDLQTPDDKCRQFLKSAETQKQVKSVCDTSNKYPSGGRSKIVQQDSSSSKRSLSKLKEINSFSGKAVVKKPFSTSVCSPRSATTQPKISNILSAVLCLIKELDYASLQVVQAEISSCLNSLEVEFLYSVQPKVYGPASPPDLIMQSKQSLAH